MAEPVSGQEEMYVEVQEGWMELWKIQGAQGAQEYMLRQTDDVVEGLEAMAVVEDEHGVVGEVGEVEGVE